MRKARNAKQPMCWSRQMPIKLKKMSVPDLSGRGHCEEAKGADKR